MTNMRRSSTDSGVSITKTINATETATVFDYEIEVHDSTSTRLQITEQLSEPLENTEISLSGHTCSSWDVYDGHQISFTVDCSHSHTVEPTLRVESTTIEPQDCTTNIAVSESDSGELSPPMMPNGNGNGNDNGSSLTELIEFSQTEPTSHTASKKTTVHDESKATIVAPLEQYHSAENTTLPVVGLIATDDTIGAVARSIVRAVDYGLTAVTVVETDQTTAASILKQLDTVVIQPEVSGLADDQLKAYVTAIVRDTVYPGVIFKEDCHETVSFEQSVQKFEATEQTVIEAVPEPTKSTVLVGIPAYNEAETVGTVVTEARNYADEVVVVDDGSTDQTADVSRQAGATVVEHDHNRGYGYGLKTLFEHAADHDTDALVILDADGQHDARDIPQLVAAHETADAEIVIGNRFGETATTEMPRYRRCGLWVITQLLNLSMGNIRPASQIQDAQSGFRSYNSTAVDSIAEQTDLIDDQMSASTDILYHAHANGFHIEEVPTTISYDVSNANTRNPITHGMSIVTNICHNLGRNHPLTVVGVPGLFCMAVGLGVGYSALSAYATSGELAVGSTIGSMVFVLGGAFVLLFAVVRHVVDTSLERPSVEQV